jgi:hypothetical protein
MKKENFIKSTFLKLTSKTYPYGFEDSFVEEMKLINLLPQDIQKDSQGNYFVKIGTSRTIFASHFDTACKSQTDVNHKIDGDIIRTDGSTILGADDKAGVTIMLWMIKNNIPGTYYFFIGEEVGCIGSGLAAKNLEFKGHYDRIISFDRRGTDSVITHQSYTRTCSDEFAKALSKQLNTQGLSYKPDDTGVYTDSAEFTHLISECTNLSVGYYKEHTHSEHQDIHHLQKLALACLKVDWESLPTVRDFTKTESLWEETCTSYKNSNWNTGYSRSQYDYGQYYGDNYYESSYQRVKTRRKRSKSRGTNYNQNGRVFYDTGFDLSELNTSYSKNSYDCHKDKLISSRLNMSEIETIKDQYLDMTNSKDRLTYNDLVRSITY